MDATAEVLPWQDWDNLEPSEQGFAGYWYHRPTDTTFHIGDVDVMALKSAVAKATLAATVMPTGVDEAVESAQTEDAAIPALDTTAKTKK